MYPCKQQGLWRSLQTAPLSPWEGNHAPSSFPCAQLLKRRRHIWRRDGTEQPLGVLFGFLFLPCCHTKLTRILPLWFYCCVEEKPCGSTNTLVPLAEGAASVSLSHSTHFRCSKNPLCGRRAWHSKCITHSGVLQWVPWSRRTIPPVEAQRDSLPLLSPSSISRPWPQHLPQFRCWSLLSVFAHEKAIQDHHLPLPETQW